MSKRKVKRLGASVRLYITAFSNTSLLSEVKLCKWNENGNLRTMKHSQIYANCLVSMCISPPPRWRRRFQSVIPMLHIYILGMLVCYYFEMLNKEKRNWIKSITPARSKNVKLKMFIIYTGTIFYQRIIDKLHVILITSLNKWVLEERFIFNMFNSAPICCLRCNVLNVHDVRVSRCDHITQPLYGLCESDLKFICIFRKVRLWSKITVCCASPHSLRAVNNNLARCSYCWYNVMGAAHHMLSCLISSWLILGLFNHVIQGWSQNGRMFPSLSRNTIVSCLGVAFHVIYGRS